MLTKRLSEADIKAAIVAWLPSQGMKADGEVTLYHDPGDRPADAPMFSATVDVEIEVTARKTRAAKG